MRVLRYATAVALLHECYATLHCYTKENDVIEDDFEIDGAQTASSKDRFARAKPTSYSPAIGDLIVERMSEGATLLAICAGDDMPARGTIYKWAELHDEFRQKLERARHAQAHFYFESMIRVAFDESGDIFIDQDATGASKAMINHAKIARDRLKVDTLKFAASKLLPKSYGDRPALEDGESKEIKISWIKSDQAPAVAPEPPKQIEYHPPKYPGDLDERSWALLLSILERVKARTPASSDRPPQEVLEAIARAVDELYADPPAVKTVMLRRGRKA